MAQCKKKVYHGYGAGRQPCGRRATEDGYCWQHHPDAVRRREHKAARRLDDKVESSLFMRLKSCEKQLQRACKRLARAEKCPKCKGEKGYWRQSGYIGLKWLKCSKCRDHPGLAHKGEQAVMRTLKGKKR